MRSRSVAFALVLNAGLPLLASAAPAPTNVLFAGAVDREYLAQGGSSWCLFDGANSTFINNGLGGRLISFPEIIIAPNGSVGPTAYTVGGQARLSFSTNPPDAGRVTFTPVDGYPADVNTPRFVDYSEVYNTASRTLTVSFTINFSACSLPFSAKYRN